MRDRLLKGKVRSPAAKVHILRPIAIAPSEVARRLLGVFGVQRERREQERSIGDMAEVAQRLNYLWASLRHADAVGRDILKRGQRRGQGSAGAALLRT